jgi:hypothetical protein
VGFTSQGSRITVGIVNRIARHKTPCVKGGTHPILDSRVLCDQQLNKRMKQRFASLSGVVHKLEETQVKREFWALITASATFGHSE